MSAETVTELRSLDHLAHRAEHMASVERFEAIRAVLADYHGGETTPRCQHVSDSPWGPTQCVLPVGHDEPHAYSPSEALP